MLAQRDTPFSRAGVGLITNQTGVDSHGVRTRVLLKKHCNLVALYTPEHGLDGTEKAGRYVKSRRDRITGLIAHSLYGPTRKPTPEMLRGVDVLVFDMQDIGCRGYTYISTMGRCMEAAGENHIPFVVLDRPNPGLGLVGHRVPVLGRPALEHVGDVDIGAAQADTREERVQQLPGGAHERLALAILVEAGRLPHDHDVGRAGPDPRHGLGPRRVEAAFGAGADLGVELLERCGAKRL